MSRLCAVMASMILLILLVGCGPTSGSQPTTASPCGQDCSGGEVTETGCDLGAVDAISDQPVQAGDTRGTLALRKANPSNCTHIYWARFTPNPDNMAAFEVVVSVNGTAFKPQPSEPGNPTLTAWTVGAYAPEGSNIQACLKSDGQEFCLPSITAV